MPTSANCPKNPSDVRADVGIRAPILPLSQQPLARIHSLQQAGFVPEQQAPLFFFLRCRCGVPEIIGFKPTSVPSQEGTQPTSSVQLRSRHRTAPLFDVRRWMFDVGCSMLDVFPRFNCGSVRADSSLLLKVHGPNSWLNDQRKNAVRWKCG